MAILKRRVSGGQTAPQAPQATSAPETPSAGRKPVRRVLGVKPVLNTFVHSADTTDYRAVVQRYKEKVKNPKTAIRAKCVECSGGSLKEVQLCPVTECALHPFRMGLNPFNKKVRERLGESVDPDADDDTDEDTPDAE